MAVDLETKIKEFQEENKISRKGQLSAVLQLTRFAGDKPFPFKPDDFLAKSKGQISSKPFVLHLDPAQSISSNLDDLFTQAIQREKESAGNHYLGTMLQHLVAAKLSVILQGNLEIHGASVADAPTGRAGDFVINNTIIHCTTAPAGPLIEKCKQNLQSGCNTVIITIFERVRTAMDLAADIGIGGRIEVWDIRQFLSANVFEHGLFDETKRNSTLSEIIDRYNEIISEVETDPSLRIEIEGKSKRKGKMSNKK